MCFDLDSAPPVPVISGAAVAHDDLVLEAADGNRFAAFLASPEEPARAGVVILAGTLATFNLPMEGAAVLLGVDAVLDMVRTSVNVTGNCLATAVVARWEGYNFPTSVELESETLEHPDVAIQPRAEHR